MTMDKVKAGKGWEGQKIKVGEAYDGDNIWMAVTGAGRVMLCEGEGRHERVLCMFTPDEAKRLAAAIGEIRQRAEENMAQKKIKE